MALPMEMLKKGMAKFEEKKKIAKKVYPEGSAEEEKGESPEEEAMEVKAGKGDKQDKKKLPFPKGKY